MDNIFLFYVCFFCFLKRNSCDIVFIFEILIDICIEKSPSYSFSSGKNILYMIILLFMEMKVQKD